ncbi:MAG: serine hydrolase [Ardenticatenaceae bacterium]|nr:serine hydrolase [Anaerolineales bacterium]MCB8920361.1 serine hydrolase [Ardenticatenaceae bacterium]MCB8989316.1 serine hydrolase [Ardenticatenaceae bacterium]
MRRSNTPGLGQWLTVSIMVAGAIFLVYKIYQYAGSRTYLPTGLTIAAVDVGGMTPEEASDILTNRYIEAPIVLYHGEDSFDVSPTEVEFTLDLETMLSEADFQRTQQDFWAGFWGFLWGRPVEVQPIELRATHKREALRDVLDRISVIVDLPPQPPQPVPATLTFQYGVAGTTIDKEASFADIEAALYRPSNREARLIVEPVNPERPSINLLARLLTNHLQNFEQTTGGIASIFIMDLATGEEVSINANVPLSGMDMLKVPIVLETYNVLDRNPTLRQRELISDTLVLRPDNLSANELLNVIAGEENPSLGTNLVTAALQRIGLQNTFIIAPYDSQGRPGVNTPQTPANTAEGIPTDPDPLMQTTAEDMGVLLSMIYYCADGQGGTLLAAFPDTLTQGECQAILDEMTLNKTGSLLEEGVPEDVPIAHRHGWVRDTHGDAGIVFSPAGDYVVVAFLYQPEWLEWVTSSPLLADISLATYNFFNFDDPYLDSNRLN